MMFRNQTRRGIRAVQAGRDPTGLCRDPDVIIPTYCNDTVVRVPPDADPAIDRRRLREIGRGLADVYLKDPPLLARTAASQPASGDGFAVEKGLENEWRVHQHLSRHELATHHDRTLLAGEGVFVSSAKCRQQE
jgi:hypothetical protein